MGFEYLVVLKKADLDAVEAKIQEAPMIYKEIERPVVIRPLCRRGRRIIEVLYLLTRL